MWFDQSLPQIFCGSKSAQFWQDLWYWVCVAVVSNSSWNLKRTCKVSTINQYISKTWHSLVPSPLENEAREICSFDSGLECLTEWMNSNGIGCISGHCHCHWFDLQCPFIVSCFLVYIVFLIGNHIWYIEWYAKCAKGDAVGLLIGHRTCVLQIEGSSPGWAPLCSGLGQATYTCVPLSPSSIIWYRPRGLISSPGKVTVGLVESNGSLPPGLWLSDVTCGLTAKKPGSAPCPTLVIEYGTIVLLYIKWCHWPEELLSKWLNKISLQTIVAVVFKLKYSSHTCITLALALRW